tara:strand:+ start:812 stop:961 length:150 start_codon:yes stop_codon:yes gene_type:complete
MSLKDSVILMGIDWSKAAKTKAMEDIELESPKIAEVISDLHSFYKSKKN